MTSNIGSENNIHANHLNIFIFLSSLLLSSINSRFTILASGANANSWSSLDQTFTVTQNGMLTISVFRLYYGTPQVFKNGAGVGAVKSQPGDSNTSKTPQCMDTFAFKVQAGDTIRVYSPTVTTGDNRGAIFIAGVVA